MTPKHPQSIKDKISSAFLKMADQKVASELGQDPWVVGPDEAQALAQAPREFIGF